MKLSSFLLKERTWIHNVLLALCCQKHQVINLKLRCPLLSVVTMNMFWLFMTHYLCFGCLWHYKKIVFFSYLNPSRRWFFFFPHSLKESLLTGKKSFNYKSTPIRNWDIQSLNLLLEITSQTLCFQYEEQPRNCSANVQKD